MDFIERALGVSPDGGSGLLEAALLLVPVFVALLAAMLRMRNGGERKAR